MELKEPPPKVIKQSHAKPEPMIAMMPEEYDTYISTTLNNSDYIPTEMPVKATIGKSVLGLMFSQLPYTFDRVVISLL